MSSQLGANFAYRAIVFQLKDNQIWEQCIVGKKLLSYRSVILCEHPEEPDESTCEWSGLHYHGLVEHAPQYRFDSDRVFNDFKAKCCAWFKSEKCNMPVNFLAYMEIPPRRKIYSNMRDDHSDLPLLEAQVTDELVMEVNERKKNRINVKQEKSKDIMYIKDLIVKTGAQSESELISIFHNDVDFETVYCKRTFTTNFRKAYMFAIQSTLDMPFRNLCINFTDQKKECLSPRYSAELMEKWCDYQSIDPQQFIQDIINVMDKRKRKLNTLILKGAPNSGKTFIAKSICKACIFYGEVTQAIAGYNFLWQDCADKRVIIINEPFFDNCMIEQLKVVLEGTGTYVHKKSAHDTYLKPTPVIITTNNHVWSHCPSAKKAIKARCLRIYDNLKPCDFLKRIKKDLHPHWMSLFCIKYAMEADPVSDITDSEDECLTGQDTVTADQAPILNKAIDREVPSTSSTSAADNTTLNSPPNRPSTRELLTKDLSRAPEKKVTSVKRSHQQSDLDSTWTPSQRLTPFFQDRKCQTKESRDIIRYLSNSDEEDHLRSPIPISKRMKVKVLEKESPVWRQESDSNNSLDLEQEESEEVDKSPQ
uniref:Nonstructural protein n=1 Tax=Lanius cristatus parvoviridae sp. TaxID=2794482 RepID=A0A8E7L4T2_9VIRU|nr:MAG: nonstructural protein [Lanius cristatus parvoviridae sp.]